MLDLFSLIKFDNQGLIPAIAQDSKTGEVLMLAFMNQESLELTLKTGLVHYFSRSRQKIFEQSASS
jgi:phosphoribosyl-AMP cyclohydrolase